MRVLGLMLAYFETILYAQIYCRPFRHLNILSAWYKRVQSYPIHLTKKKKKQACPSALTCGKKLSVGVSGILLLLICMVPITNAAYQSGEESLNTLLVQRSL